MVSILQYVIRMSQDVSQLCHKMCRKNVISDFNNLCAKLGSIPRVTLNKLGAFAKTTLKK